MSQKTWHYYYSLKDEYEQDYTECTWESQEYSEYL